jgi:hypothetical protein
MTDYFDRATRAVREISRDLSGEDFLREVATIEEPIVRDVLLNTGDREFPDELREKILGAIATKGVFVLSDGLGVGKLGPTAEARDYALATRYSELIEDLHSAFHALASRRTRCRWGFWSDSPRQNLVSRKDYDEPDADEADADG